jgi:hypothetical protein
MIESNSREIGRKFLGWILVVEDRLESRIFVNTVKNFLVQLWQRVSQARCPLG